MADVAKLAGDMKKAKIDTSKITVADDDDVLPCAANSPEEAEALAAMIEALPSDFRRSQALPSESLMLKCLRGRKYDVPRAAETLQSLLKLKSELEMGDPKHREQLLYDLGSGKVTNPGSKDEVGRSLIWLRLRNHDKSKSGPQDMGRAVATVMLNACEDVDTQRMGIVLLNDLSGIQLKNIHPPTAKFVLGEVLPNLPIRLQRFVLYNPPWFVANVLLPIVTVFMSAKVKSRLHICKTREELHAAIAPSMLPEELGGTQPFDLESWAAKVSK